jgi:hypothetical protein
MALISLTQTSSGSSFKLDDSEILKVYSRGAQTVVEYVKADGLRKSMDVDESTTTIVGSSTKLITTSHVNEYLFLNVDRVISTHEENSLVQVTYDSAGDNPEVIQLDVTEAVFLVDINNTSLYKIYSANLSQTGTNPPVATVFENTLGGTVVWTYDGVGTYIGTLTGAMPIAKTQRYIGSAINVGAQTIHIDNGNDNETWVEHSGGNDSLTDTAIKIVVYN